MTASPVGHGRLPVNTILVGDALKQLTRLPAASVDCIINSPESSNPPAHSG
jgi:hypothetical protein